MRGSIEKSDIRKVVDRLVKKHNTTNILELIKAEKIATMKTDVGEEAFYLARYNLMIYGTAPYQELKKSLAYELGEALLHKQILKLGSWSFSQQLDMEEQSYYFRDYLLSLEENDNK